MHNTMRAALAVATLLVAEPAFAQTAAPSTATKPEGRADRGMGALFERVDADRDGRVTMPEAWAFVQARFAEADADRDGGLTQQEAANLRPDGRRGGPGRDRADGGERGAGMFRGLDANRDQKIQLDELRGPLEAMFRARDSNGDNAVSREELAETGHGRGGERSAPSGRTPG